MVFPRSMYIQPDHVAVDCGDTDAAIWTREVVRDGKVIFSAVGFHGKANKPDFRYAFTDAERRRKYIEAFIRGRAARAQVKTERKREEQQPHTLRTGDILSSSWGYDQTNIDFYEVTKIVGAFTVEIRELAKNSQGNGYFMQGTCEPIPGKYTGPPERKRANHRNCIRIESYAVATPWDHKPEHWTAYA